MSSQANTIKGVVEDMFKSRIYQCKDEMFTEAVELGRAADWIEKTVIDSGCRHKIHFKDGSGLAFQDGIISPRITTI